MKDLRPVEKQWLFPHSALNNTPSLDDGIDLQTELKRRKVIIEYMRSLALRANAIVNGDDPECTRLRGSMIVGSTLVHRFYMRRSLRDFSEKLIAPTILFLATKIEEEPLKLRHIVNSCIAKFEPQGARGWYPDNNPHEQPPREYRTWERSILATEEVLLEALCFDMAVDQPYPTLLRSVSGLDEIISKMLSNGIDSNGIVIGTKSKEKLSEGRITEIGWTVTSESSLSPLPILYPVPIISFVIFTFIISIIDQIPPSHGLWNASESSERFGLDLGRKGNDVLGHDLDMVKACLDDLIRYINQGLILDDLKKYIVEEPEQQTEEPYPKRFILDVAPNKENLGTNGVLHGKIEIDDDVNMTTNEIAQNTQSTAITDVIVNNGIST
ncbi:uncharacterized protein L199_001812 [Kwoniella botswanensis]|uniref:uncharacterized protein n=1 Tax=Kwoniella botswanensis TaxID=1268659 RepID=UPI00315D2C5A